MSEVSESNPMQDNRIALGDSWRTFMEKLDCAEYDQNRDRIVIDNADDFEECVKDLRVAIVNVLGLEAPGYPEVLSTVEFATIPVLELDELSPY